MVTAAVAYYGSHIPWNGRSWNRKVQARNLAPIKLGSEEYANSGFGKISAMPLKFSVLVAQEMADGDSELAAVPRMPSAATARLAGCRFWR